MLRFLSLVLLLALVAPAPALSQDARTEIADPENRARAEAMLDGFWPELNPFVGRLFSAQFSCQKDAFAKAKGELLAQIDEQIERTKLLKYGPAFLPKLTAFRDFIKSLQYRDCPKPNRQQLAELARQRHAMDAFRGLFRVIRVRGIADGYAWLQGGPIGELFEDLVFYQRICDHEGFDRVRANVRALVEERLSKDTTPTKEEALRILDKIVYVPCGDPKPRPVTNGQQQPPQSGGTGQNTTPSPNATPTPAVTPGPGNETPDEEKLPGLDDEPLPGLDDEPVPGTGDEKTQDAGVAPGSEPASDQQTTGTATATPAVRDEAIGTLNAADEAIDGTSQAYISLVEDLFDAQFSCSKPRFDKAKTALVEALGDGIGSARAAFGRSARLDNRLRFLVELRDLVSGLVYKDCDFKPDVQVARAVDTFRNLFDARKASCADVDCPPDLVFNSYAWTEFPLIGSQFEDLMIYQWLCDERGFNAQKERLRASLNSPRAWADPHTNAPYTGDITPQQALDALNKITFVYCPKTHTATAEPQPTSGETEQNTTSPNITPTPAVTPGSEDQTPHEERLPGLDDPPSDEQQETEDASYEPGASYTIAVQVPDVCLGKIYTVTEGTVVQTAEAPVIRTEQEPSVTWTDIPVVTGSGEMQVDIPAETVTSENVTVENVPSEDAPTEAVPVASVPEENTQDTPQVDVPVASAPEESDEPEEEIDLGLAKSEETVLVLALTGQNDGKQITAAVVKSLGEEPPLPGDPGVETAFDADAFFEDGVDAGVSGEDGSVEISFAADAAATSTDQSGNGQPQDAGPGQTLTVNLPIDDTPREKLVAGLGGEAPAREAVSAAMRDATLSRYVTDVFAIGTQPILVMVVPRGETKALKLHIKTAKLASWLESVPCRNKEDEIDDPYFSESGLWGQDFDDQWAIKRAGFSGKLIADAMNGADTKPVVVAVIDTGLDWYHPDFNKDAIWRNDGEIPSNGVDDDDNGYTDDTIGWNFVNRNNRPWDHDGHGTFVAGVIAAATNNAVGIAGVSPGARIMPLKALDAFGRGDAATIAEAIAYAADNGARVINLSLGGRGLTRVERLAVEHAAASGALVIVAAGNSGADVSDYGPAGLDGVISVSATDRRDRQAGFSNWGEEIDIAAPGVDVLSLRARKTDLLSYIPGVKYEPGAGIVGETRAYFRASGTSFAAPIVTGAAALIMSIRPEVDADAARRMLLNAARDIETPGIDNFTGYGLLDVQAALAADPDFSIESRIERVEPVEVQGKPALRLIGTADASQFASASLALGAGKDPKNWRRIKKRIEAPVRDDVLMDLPAGAFRGSKSWTIRLITTHKNGEEREARFSVTLG